MNDGQWRVRIGTDADVTLGAGILLDSTRVLTCAHVVAAARQGDPDAKVCVAVPGGPSGLRADVVTLTDWEKLDDRGDIALLVLEAPLNAAPARFAHPAERYWTGELRALGFSHGFEQNGTYITLSTARDMTLAQEWWQVKVDPKDPGRIEEGFSGAAVYRPRTGEVIGIITDAVPTENGKVGRMLPLDSLRRHWEDLDDFLSLDWLTADDRADLRRALRETPLPGPVLRDLYDQVFPAGPEPGAEFTSVWQAIRFVAEEVLHGQDRLERFLSALSDALPMGTVRRLSPRLLPNGLSPSPQPPPGQVTGDNDKLTSIVVRLDRRNHGGTFDLSFSCVVKGVLRATIDPVEACEKRDSRQAQQLPTVREEVERRLPTLLPHVMGTDWIIEFALPESWLGKAVEDWKLDDTDMWTYPVVVKDVDRMRPTPRRDKTMLRWQRLHSDPLAKPRPVKCADRRSERQFLSWLTVNQDLCEMVLPRRPRRPLLTAALLAGIPVMMWPRISCAESPHDTCLGTEIAERIANRVADTDPDLLPWLVRQIRAEARGKDAGKQHYGRHLTLLWDDPTRLPDPALAVAT